jgi:hypothetical protein
MENSGMKRRIELEVVLEAAVLTAMGLVLGSLLALAMRSLVGRGRRRARARRAPPGAGTVAGARHQNIVSVPAR